MVRPPVSAILGQYGNSGTIDVSQFDRTGSAYTNTDPNAFALMLEQAKSTIITNNLFGDEDDAQEAIFGTSSFYPSSQSSGLFGNQSYLPAELVGAAGGSSVNATSPQYVALIARSNLLGKSVTAYDSSNNLIEGTVNRVTVDNGNVLIQVGDTYVPAENLQSASL